MDSKIIKYIILFVFIFSFESKSVEFNGKFIQGHFILGKTDPGSEIEIDNKRIKVTKDGDFVFGQEEPHAVAWKGGGEEQVLHWGNVTGNVSCSFFSSSPGPLPRLSV